MLEVVVFLFNVTFIYVYVVMCVSHWCSFCAVRDT